MLILNRLVTLYFVTYSEDIPCIFLWFALLIGQTIFPWVESSFTEDEKNLHY